MIEGQIKLYEPTVYEIDWNKVQTVSDVVEILKAMEIKVTDDGRFFENLKPYLQKVSEGDTHE